MVSLTAMLGIPPRGREGRTMTTPNERTRAVVEMAQEVQRLEPYMHGNGDTVRVPREALRRLYALLRHYPMPSELTVTAQRVPELWAAIDGGRK